MAIQIPIITSLEDAGIKAAKAAFNNFKTAVGDAEGSMNKFKAGSKAALDSVKANASTFAIAAGASLVTFGIKAANTFKDFALASDRLSDSTGLAVEEASRLLEVTADLGIEAASLETGIDKMNKKLGQSPELFKELGVKVAYAKDGTVDVNETFINVIDLLNKIPDPAKRAAVAAELLGKGWRDMGKVIFLGADQLRKSLNEVSEAKTIDREEVDKATRYRNSLNDLNDIAEDLTITIGEKLVPRLEKAAEYAKEIAPYFDFAANSAEFLGAKMSGTPGEQFTAQMNLSKSALKLFGIELGKKETQEDLVNLGGYMERASEGMAEMNRQTLNAMKYGKMKPLEPLTTEANQLATELKNVKDAWELIVAQFDEQVAFDQAVEKLAEVEEAAAQAFASGADSDIAKYNVAAADMVGLLALISEGLGSLASREIKLRFQAEGFPAALALAQYYKGGAEFMNLNPEQALTQAGIPTLSAASSGGAGTIGGSTINVTVTSADPNQVVAAIQEWTRNNGAIPLATTTNVRR